MKDSANPLAWITGAGGLIGSHIARAAPRCAPGWRVIGLTRAELDLTDLDALRRRFEQDRPGVIIHCAALSKSVACEADPDLARLLNVEVTRRLAALDPNVRLLLFSTDLVFDGTKGGYTEDDPVNPLSVYARTKRAAEETVLAASPQNIVVRTSLNGGASPTGDRAFTEEMRLAWKAGRTLKLFTDEFRCPIPVKVTARAIWELILSGSSGLFHLAGAERLSRWELGKLIAERCPELNPRMERSSLRDYKGPPRSPDTSLDCSKIQQLLSFPLPKLSEWLAEHPNEPF